MTGIMQANVNPGVFFEVLQKRQIGILVRLLENVFEIAAGLVSVNEKGKMESLRHGNVFFSSL